MDQDFAITFAASTLAGLMTTSGILAIRRFEDWARDNIAYFISFAAGVLIAVSLVHMVPKSLGMSGHAPAMLLAGYFLMYGMNRFVAAHVCDKSQSPDYALGIIPLIGIGFHSFIDGIVYSISFNVSLATGGLVALGMVLHEFPEGIVTYMLLIRGGFTKHKALVLALLAAAVTTPLGTLASYPFVSTVDPMALGSLLALSAGALLFVGATHLLPRAEEDKRRFSVLALGAGVVVAVGISLSHGWGKECESTSSFEAAAI
jgi:zinc transporter ZupT